MDLFIAVLSYDGKVTHGCANSLMRNMGVLVKANHRVMPYFHVGDTFIDRARNVCSHLFLWSGCSDIIFIDSDQTFDSDAILKLLEYDRDIVAGAVPVKHDSSCFVCEPDFSSGNDCKDIETGYVIAKTVGTGFIRIKREVFNKMILSYSLMSDKDGLYDFFKTGRSFTNDNTWYGEDIFFCKRWNEMGGKILVNPNITFQHTGIKNYGGNYLDFLLKR
jgi:hypothetical protein